MGIIKLMETLHEHLMVQGSSTGRCKDGKVACSAQIDSKYDGDFWATSWFMLQYWFMGLGYIAVGGPFFMVSMFIQGVFYLIDPTTMPGKLTDTTRFAGDNAIVKMWNWLSVYTARLFMPYAWMFTGLAGGNYSELNIRNMDANTGGLYMLLQWTFLPVTWIQAVLMFVLSSPAWLIVLPVGFIKMFV